MFPFLALKLGFIYFFCYTKLLFVYDTVLSDSNNCHHPFLFAVFFVSANFSLLICVILFEHKLTFELFFQRVTLVICDKGHPIFSLHFIFSNYVSLAFSLFYFTIGIVNCCLSYSPLFLVTSSYINLAVPITDVFV